MSDKDKPDLVLKLSFSGSVAVALSVDYETASYYELTVAVSDPGGLSASATLTISITDVQEPPVISNMPSSDISVSESETTAAVIFTVTATDPEGDVIIYSLSPAPNDGKFNIHGSSMNDNHAHISPSQNV